MINENPEPALRLAFIGYGEVGQLFGRQFAQQPGITVSAYDLKMHDPVQAKALKGIADRDGVLLAGSAAAAVEKADIVFSAVTASSTRAVAEKALGYLTAHQVLFDLNSASPRTKAGCGEALAARGLAYVEGAVMAPVAEPGIRVSILAGGAQAMDVAERLNPRGMAIRVVSDTIGRASATKLCRSIMIKGIEALIIDSARASAAWGVSEDVFASLGATFPGQDWAHLARLMDSRVARHGIRRAAEMREAAQMLAELGLSPSLSEAIAEAHERRVLQPPAE
ncbi:DUF1932 domain-containing protein [Rhabdaerophilum sp. SD176]|uniref:DUF1932 domain-containing protein n=1 Tax=Rhabdaerophilum sp. SD176 TaxID=2983548 RepID=UPI0024DFD612|nr:DUF1932 domain-containing protein [Rhabdaerophilum sp. SD176]